MTLLLEENAERIGVSCDYWQRSEQVDSGTLFVSILCTVMALILLKVLGGVRVKDQRSRFV